MKDNYKWILAAIVVLLVILVGAYALSNGSNQPVVNASATPVATATPTPTPVISSTAAPSATAVPTIAPTVTPAPTATPTPTPSGSIQQTQFGYVITYPPFATSYDIHVNPNYVPRPATTISFASSSNIDLFGLQGASLQGRVIGYNQIELVRTDSLGGSVTAHVTLIANSTYVPRDSVIYDHTVTFHDNQATALMSVNMQYETIQRDGNKDQIQGDGYMPNVTFEIVPDSSYNVGAIDQYTYYMPI